MDNERMNITPTPRILRTLGEIPFKIWQCVAELIDNSLDAFLKEAQDEDENREIRINWSSDNVSAAERTLEVKDNAAGMTIAQLQNAVRAGYSSNDPIGNLGLFGVGFNIATARLGEKTTILTTRKGDLEWIGVVIDFNELIMSGEFDAPIISEVKNDVAQSGTIVKISRLRSGIISELANANKERDMRQRLESVYSPLLGKQEISIYVKGRQLKSREHCVWSPNRYVVYNQKNVPCRITIDRDLGSALFDVERNVYLTPSEAELYFDAVHEGEQLPDHIIERAKRLTGWLGIQRFADPNEYGIDFVRNGRKILVSDKSLFYYEHPLTGNKLLQYPTELGTTIGGRIVGELNVDYLLPTYQKNDFDKTDSSWEETVQAICGDGPIRPKDRKSLQLTTENTSPLAQLVSAYARVDAGTKCLFAPNDLARNYAAEFRKGVREYMDDSLWWKAAQEEDQRKHSGGARTTPVNAGDSPSDDVDDYLNNNGTSNIGTNQNQDTTSAKKDDQSGKKQIADETFTADKTSKLDELLSASSPVTQLNGSHYKYNNIGTLTVRAYELTNGDIWDHGEIKPCYFASDGTTCDFVYNPRHPLIAQYPITPKLLLLMYLSEKFKARDTKPDLVSVFSSVVQHSMPEAKIDKQSLHERSRSALDFLRDKIATALRGQAKAVVDCLHESAGDVEEIATSLIQTNQDLLELFQNKDIAGYDAIYHIPDKTVVRLIERFPNEIFDGKVLKTMYNKINLPDEKTTKRMREEAKERALGFVKDAVQLMGAAHDCPKDELTRLSMSVDALLKELGQ